MRIKFKNVGPNKMYIDLSNNEYMVVCDILGASYKVTRDNITDVKFIPNSTPVTILGLPTAHFKSSLNISFKHKDVSKVAMYNEVDKEYLENAYNEVVKWIG
ncbi:MAG: hypothetical protein RSC24_14830 [Clostridium sp.]